MVHKGRITKTEAKRIKHGVAKMNPVVRAARQKNAAENYIKEQRAVTESVETTSSLARRRRAGVPIQPVHTWKDRGAAADFEAIFKLRVEEVLEKYEQENTKREEKLLSGRTGGERDIK